MDHVGDVSCLWILRPGDWHAVWASWLPTGERYGWYVNLQRPFRRTATGIESMDLAPDGPPFGEDWDSWRPDPAWATPRLPAGWDDVPA